MKKDKSVPVLICSAILILITMFLPYAKTGLESKSLFGMAILYLNSSSSEWNDKAYETFYRVFVPGMVVLICIFIVLLIISVLKNKLANMLLLDGLVLASYTLLKMDFYDRGVVPGSCDKGMAYYLMDVLFGLILIGTVWRMIILKSAKKNSGQ